MAFLGPSLRRRKLRERPAARATAAVLLSIAANALLLLLLASTGVFDVKAPTEARPVSLAPLSAAQWEANRSVAGAAPARPPVRPPVAVQVPPPPRAPAVRGQVVEVAPSADGRPPKETRFLADRDNTVEKETRSRHAGKKLWENTLPAPSAGSAEAAARAPSAGEGGAAERARPGRAGAPSRPEAAPPRRRSGEQRVALAPGREGDAEIRVPGLVEPSPPQRPGGSAPGLPGDGEGGERSAGSADLRPDAAMLERIAGGPSTDRLDGVEEGEVTALNTRGFRYSTFLVRVKRAIYSNWKPDDAYLARDPEFRMYPVRDRTTALEFVLDASGNLESIRILEGSGLDFLDQEIVRAIRKAAPFPNPPAGLVDEAGKIRLGAQYTYVLRHVRSQFVGGRGLR